MAPTGPIFTDARVTLVTGLMTLNVQFASRLPLPASHLQVAVALPVVLPVAPSMKTVEKRKTEKGAGGLAEWKQGQGKSPCLRLQVRRRGPEIWRENETSVLKKPIGEVAVEASGYFTPGGDFGVRFVFEGPLDALRRLLSRSFPYTVLFEKEERDRLNLELIDESEGSVVWRSRDQSEAREAMGRVVERGGFEEETDIISEGGSSTRTRFRKISGVERTKFRTVLEKSLQPST